MSVHNAKVSLSAPSHLTMSEQWSQIWAGISAQLPLRNLHWKPASRTSIRTIQTLNVDLHALETLREEAASQVPTSLLEKPLLNVYIIACEDTESYKSTVRKQVKDWHAQVSQRKNQEWVIINVSKTDGKQAQSGLLKMRGTVLDRLRADFNVDKKDRCAQATWSTEYKSPTVWAEAMSKIKDGIIVAFDQAVTVREEEVKRSEQQRTMPGWNFCTFFLIKESLASSFEGAGLFEDALLQYEELEASFFQVLKDRTLWFGKFIEVVPKDDSAPLLSLSKKPYRDLIIANAISVFDIRVYLLARQCQVLGQMRRVTDVARKVELFLGAFGGRLQEIKNELPAFFVESWTYSSALSAVDACDEWAQGQELVPAASNIFNAVKGELLALARQQLDRIGVRLGYLPNETPFSSAFNSDEGAAKASNAEKKRMSQSVSSQDVLSSINSKVSFYDVYTKLTNRAIDLFVKAGRRKFALKLHGSLAALDLVRERHSNAMQTYASLPAHYAPHKWSSLEAYMLFRSIETHSRMQNDHDRQWIHTALAFIKTYLEGNGTEFLSGFQARDQYISRLVEAIIESSTKVEGELVFQDSPMLLIFPVVESGRCAGDRDGLLFDVIVKNMLPCDLPLDKVAMTFSGRGSEILDFVSDSATVKPGSQTITMYCPTPLSGAFIVDKAEAHIGQISFTWQMKGKQHVPSQSSSSRKGFNTLVKFPIDPLSVRLDIQQSPDVEITGKSHIKVDLHCGRNTLSTSTLVLSSSNATFDMKNATRVEEGSASLNFANEYITINQANSEAVLCLEIPYMSPGNSRQIEVKASLEYETTQEAGVKRKLVLVKKIQLSRDIAVIVQDYFRGDKLLTKFIVSTTSHQHARISFVNLEASEADQEILDIKGAGALQGVITVTPSQPATFLYQIQPHGEVKDPLKLSISYLLLREEVEGIVAHCIQSTLKEVPPTIRDAVHDKVIDILESFPTWIDLYETTGQIRFPQADIDIEGLEKEDRDRLADAFDNASSAPRPRGKRFITPVDMPKLDIFASAKLDLVANPFETKPLPVEDMPPVFAGQPVTAIISIHTSFFWAAKDKDVKLYRMRFQVDENIKDWLISGQKRGEFKAQHNTTFQVTVTLMAVRHGELPLPSVQISAYPLESSHSTAPPTLETYQEHAAERLLVLPRGGRTTYFLNVGGEMQMQG